MKLFDSKDVIVKDIAVDSAPIVHSEQVDDTVLIGNDQLLFSNLYSGDFGEGECISYMSNGNWSMYHLADAILKKIGPCDLYIATWSISEFSARTLCQWLDEGQVTSVKALFDFRSKNRHPAAFHLAKHSFSKVKIALCHAKVSVFVNASKNKYISVNGSPNWTENPRIESGVIISSKLTAEKHIKWINEMIEKGEYELD